MTDLSPEAMAQRLAKSAKATAATEETLSMAHDFLSNPKLTDDARQMLLEGVEGRVSEGGFKKIINETVQELNRLTEIQGMDAPSLNSLKDNATVEEALVKITELRGRNQGVHSHLEILAKEAEDILKLQGSNVANNISPTKGFFGKFKDHLAESGKDATRTTGSTVAGVAIGASGIALVVDGFNRIRDKDKNTAVGILETGAGVGLATDGGLRATTGKGAGFWVQKVSQAAKSAHSAHVI